jgi:murein L,D-transpeptidase YcbB/YkuD
VSASWILIPCLVTLRKEFDKIAPGRDHASDGSIGNLAHQQESSDHNPDETGRTPYSDTDKLNEVHAIDVDDDLRKTGWTMDRAVQIIVTRHRAGLDDRLQNVIYNRRIWSRSWGWAARAYTGASTHTEHAHFSARYTTAQESDTRAWGLLAADTPTPKPGGKSDPKPGSRTLKKGMSGADVAFLKRWLGLSTGTTFDAALDTKVRAYQKMRGITADGICGRDTWKQMGIKATY